MADYDPVCNVSLVDQAWQNRLDQWCEFGVRLHHCQAAGVQLVFFSFRNTDLETNLKKWNAVWLLNLLANTSHLYYLVSVAFVSLPDRDVSACVPKKRRPSLRFLSPGPLSDGQHRRPGAGGRRSQVTAFYTTSNISKKKKGTLFCYNFFFKVYYTSCLCLNLVSLLYFPDGFCLSVLSFVVAGGLLRLVAIFSLGSPVQLPGIHSVYCTVLIISCLPQDRKAV